MNERVNCAKCGKEIFKAASKDGVCQKCSQTEPNEQHNVQKYLTPISVFAGALVIALAIVVSDNSANEENTDNLARMPVNENEQSAMAMSEDGQLTYFCLLHQVADGKTRLCGGDEECAWGLLVVRIGLKESARVREWRNEWDHLCGSETLKKAASMYDEGTSIRDISRVLNVRSAPLGKILSGQHPRDFGT